MISIEEAKAKQVCRVCGKAAGARAVTPTLVDSFVLNYGEEFAHATCIGQPLTEVWPGFPKLVPDGVTEDGSSRFRTPSADN